MNLGSAALRPSHEGSPAKAAQKRRNHQAAKLLVVDDDPELRDLIAEYLRRQGYEVATAHDGVAMDEALAGGDINLVLLDLMLPGEDGMAIAKRLKTAGDLPIIMVSAQGEDVDRIAGLEVGADDYIAKPFNPRELLARVRAVLRRVDARERQEENPLVAFGDFVLDLRSMRFTKGGSPMPLTTGEHELLGVLARHPNQVLDRDAILGELNGMERTPFDRSIDMRIARLRGKIEPRPSEPRFIRTVWGRGYMFCPDAG